MQEKINNQDCPEKAKPYPGKISRNNPNGCVLSKEEYIKNVVLDWVRYLRENCREKYEDATCSHKLKYLGHHLVKVKTGFKKGEIYDILLDAERSLNRETEQEILDSQDPYMDVEV